jgi:hypothetical protein
MAQISPPSTKHTKPPPFHHSPCLHLGMNNNLPLATIPLTNRRPSFINQPLLLMLGHKPTRILCYYIMKPTEIAAVGSQKRLNH